MTAGSSPLSERDRLAALLYGLVGGSAAWGTDHAAPDDVAFAYEDADSLIAAGIGDTSQLKTVRAERDAATAVIAEVRAQHRRPRRPKIFCTCGEIICETQVTVWAPQAAELS